MHGLKTGYETVENVRKTILSKSSQNQPKSQNKSSKKGRVIDTSKKISVPILEEGKTRFCYPKNHNFKTKSVDYKGYLEFMMNEYNILHQRTYNLLENFEKLSDLNIKNAKTIRGHEGESCMQCNVYLKNKKVAEFNGYEWFSGQEINVIDESLFSIDYERDTISIVNSGKTETINISDFKALLEEMHDMKKLYKFIS